MRRDKPDEAVGPGGEEPVQDHHGDQGCQRGQAGGARLHPCLRALQDNLMPVSDIAACFPCSLDFLLLFLSTRPFVKFSSLSSSLAQVIVSFLLCLL